MHGHVNIIFSVWICMKKNDTIEQTGEKTPNVLISLKEKQLLFNFNGFHSVL